MNARISVRCSARTALCVIAAAVTRPAASGTVVASGPDMSFQHPEASEDGLVVAFERQHAMSVVCPPAGCVTFTDVMLLDLRADCGQDVLAELTRDGVSRDPSVTADGSLVGFRTVDTSTTPPTNRFFTMLSDGGAPMPACAGSTPATCDDASQAVDHLELSPTGRYLVYWRRTGTAEQLVQVDLSLPAPAPHVLDSASEILLADQHPIADDGTVYYCKPWLGRAHVWKVGPPSWVPVLLVTGLTTEQRTVSTGRDGRLFAFTSRDVTTDVTDLWVSGDWSLQLTFGQPGWSMQAVGISATGERVTFASHGDYAPLSPNSDGSVEVFSTGTTGGTVQLTTFTGDPAQADKHRIRGVTPVSTGVAAFHAHGACSAPPTCATLADEHSFSVTYESPAYNVPVPPPPTEQVAPPFEMAGAVPAECTAGPDEETCTAFLRNSSEGPRNILAVLEWSMPTCGVFLTRLPMQISLAAGEQARLEDVVPIAACSGAEGKFRVFAVSTDVTEADSSTLEATFTVP